MEGKGSISKLEVETPNGTLFFSCTVKADQFFILDFDGTACLTDMNFNILNEIEMEGSANLDEGESEVKFTCEVRAEDGKTPHATVRFVTRGVPGTLRIH
ncbi:MAG: hypothetical protein II426_01780 [Methanobrevibacter sp.]|nr:hypothetical protein [Methanobrevibacter sp.]